MSKVKELVESVLLTELFFSRKTDQKSKQYDDNTKKMKKQASCIAGHSLEGYVEYLRNLMKDEALHGMQKDFYRTHPWSTDRCYEMAEKIIARFPGQFDMMATGG